MAINPETLYAGKITPSSSSYPYGQARNITTPGDGTGTPWEAALVNDIFGFQQALLSRASIVPSGTADAVGASQYMQSVGAIFDAVYDDVSAMINDSDVAVGNTVRTIERVAGSGGGGVYKVVLTSGVTPNTGNIIVGVADATLSFTLVADAVHVDQWGAIGDGDGAGGGTDNATAIQLAADYIVANGGVLVGDFNKIYRCDSAITVLGDQNSVERIYGLSALRLDFSASGLTSGPLVHAGADAEINFTGAAAWLVDNVIVIGPESQTPTGNTADGATIGVFLEYAHNVSISNVWAPYCHNAIKTKFTFPLVGSLCRGSLSYIPLLLQGASNNHTWIGYQCSDVQWGPVIQDIDNRVSNVVFIAPRIEGADSGWVLESDFASGNRIRDIQILGCYYANVTYDFIRTGRVFDDTAPATRGADAAGEVYNLITNGGNWGNGGAWTATHAALVCSTAAGLRGADIHGDIEDDSNAIVGKIESGQVAFFDQANATHKIVHFSGGNRVLTISGKGLEFDLNAFTDGDTTPDVGAGNLFVTANTSPTVITDFDGGGTIGKTFRVLINDDDTEFDFRNSSTIFGNGGFSWQPKTNDYMEVVYDGTNYRCEVVNCQEDAEAVIASGVITAPANSCSVDTESDAASDDLDTINGNYLGFGLLTLRPEDAARTVVVKDGTGNLALAGSDFSMDNINDRIVLEGTDVGWVEISRSNNGA